MLGALMLRVVRDWILALRGYSLEAVPCVATAEVRQRVALRVWGPYIFCKSPPHNLTPGCLTSRAHVCFDPALTAAAVLPTPRSIEGRFTPISARGEQEHQRGHAGPVQENAVVELGGQGRPTVGNTVGT
jgi:hypothetical protein